MNNRNEIQRVKQSTRARTIAIRIDTQKLTSTRTFDTPLPVAGSAQTGCLSSSSSDCWEREAGWTPPRRSKRLGQQKNAKHKAAKKRLVTQIKASKGKCWKVICREVDDDLWGNDYLIITLKFVGLGLVAYMEPDRM
ncbi:Protein of unknown function [Cotesia congregata]|uniref:Uncharacterized protein n=1 Tax=Cotesia congregata TaxID=51543 RepID=A0A8J2H5C3_COTCN|nr:Protein of unknown function [Cotesia congregata]